MRTSWVAVSIATLLLASCTYDRELLGEVAREEPVFEPTDEPESEPIEFIATDDAWSPADSLDMFADLGGFGSWYWLEPFGWVWRPIVSLVWAPMLEGHWEWTVHGWMWISTDPFGSTPYNYGYWVEDITLGWVWVPDTSWNPTRCEWIQWDDFIAWCPTPPPCEHDYAYPWDYGDDTPWITIPVAKFKETHLAAHRKDPKFKPGISDKTVRRAPLDLKQAERLAGRTLEPVNYQQLQMLAPQPLPVSTVAPAPPGGSVNVVPVLTNPGEPTSSGGSGKMKGRSGSAGKPSDKNDSPPKFKDIIKDPPKGGEKKKAK